ncbi:N-alpha-acetyltransferase 30 [Acyrthosiphon pisum]|uniref:N-terminal methionine N(alpha)-acetyltransferase NatC n=1 Tax=Acyrthosiphon pisum TaxID=7029 RepID=A0A8R1W6J7_ACYPI|nr:N-alpha-acetyltransferase 30 [Acyrthosiphon pisum]|eukprot:XP_001950193.1 PREDICTED: N-alpha-acetyltransferase 30-like [Acyrthosiphon pisum]
MADVQLQSHELDTRDDDNTVVLSDVVNRVVEPIVYSNTDLIEDVSRLSISENNVYSGDVAQNNLPCLNSISSSSTSSSSSSQCKPSCSSSDVNNSNLAEGLQQIDGVKYVCYKNEQQMKDIMRLIQKDLSEPYSIYTYRYFIHNWPKLCFLAVDVDKSVGAIVCKLDAHRKVRRGYIAMLAVDENYRKQHIGSNLVLNAIEAMVNDGADEVVLETEITNKPALKLYENLGFVRDKRLFCYYLNGVDALRLKLWLR